jgi:hypothetical protein
MLQILLRNFFVHFPRAVGIALLVLFLDGCESSDDSVIESAGTAPFLAQVHLSPSRINSDTINTASNRQPDDLLTISTTVIAQVQVNPSLGITASYSVSSPDSLQIVSRGTLMDDGQTPDRTEGDGLFTGTCSFQIRRVQVGTYVVEVKAESEGRYSSNALMTPLTVYRGNRAPILSSLVTPDTIKLGNESQVVLLSVRADDPDGHTDITRVLFNSFKPDNSASGSNPFTMYDDGLTSHGDEKAGDGVFSLLISLPSNTLVGTYRFEFQAFDRSNEPSNVIVHRLTVIP